jgi:hypothetical protein
MEKFAMSKNHHSEPERESLADKLERTIRASRRYHGLPEEPTEEQRAAMALFLGLWDQRPMDDTGDEEDQRVVSDWLRAARQERKKPRGRRKKS